VAVLVPVYNAPEWTVRCLSALNSVPAGFPFDLFVHDDASPSEKVWPALNQVKDKYSSLRLSRSSQNNGFLGSCNMLFEELRSKYDFVFLCNSDVVVTEGWLSSGLAVFEKHPNCALVSYFATKGAQLSLMLPEGVSFEDANLFLREYSYEGTCRAVTSVGHLLGIRTSAISGSEKLFDPVFGKGYGEESDLHYRLLERGFEALVVPNSMVYHRGESSFGFTSQKPQTKVFHERWGAVHEKAQFEEIRKDSLAWIRDLGTNQLSRPLARRMLEFVQKRDSLIASRTLIFVSSIVAHDFLDEICLQLFELIEKDPQLIVVADKDNDITRRLPGRVYFLDRRDAAGLKDFIRKAQVIRWKYLVDTEVSKEPLRKMSLKLGLPAAEPSVIMGEKSGLEKTSSARIIVIAPDYCLSGGIFVICDFIQAMLLSGYDVTVATPSGSLNHDNVKYGGQLCSVAYARKHYGSPYDLFVFTWWESLFWGSRIPARRFLWIAQSIEEYFPPPERPDERIRALAPYLLRGIEVISISPWIQAVLSTRFGTESELIWNQLPSDINWDSFTRQRDWQNVSSPADCSVVVEGSFIAYKNVPAAIELCNKLGFGRKTLIFSGSPNSWEEIEDLKKQGWTVLNNLSRSEVIDQFSKADVLLRMSLLDSFGFAPLEMMATGGLVMVQHYQGAPGLCINGVNSICFAEPNEINKAFERNLETGGDYFNKLTLNGVSTSHRFKNTALPKYQEKIARILNAPVDSTRNAALQAVCDAVSAGLSQGPEFYQHFAYSHELSLSKGKELIHSGVARPLRYKIADYIVLKGIKRLVPMRLYKALKQRIER
jgi:GT2 family glycosyltransferase